MACDVTQTLNFLRTNVIFDRYRYGHPDDGPGIWKEGTASGTTWQNIDGSAGNTPPDWASKTQLRRVDIYQSLTLGAAFIPSNPPTALQNFICGELNIIDSLTAEGVTLTVEPGSVLFIAERLNMVDHNGGSLKPTISMRSNVSTPDGQVYFSQLAPTNALLNGNFVYDVLITEREWHHMMSPISTPLSGVQFFTVDANGNATTTASPYTFGFSGGGANIYRWNATGASWQQTSGAADFSAEPYTIFFPNTQLPLVMRVAGELAFKDQNLFEQKPAVNGNAGTNTSSGFGAPDWMGASNRNGWNFYGNPFLSWINTNRLVSNYGASMQDVASTVYAYQPFKNGVSNGANYFNHNGTSGDVNALNIQPFQAIFQQHIAAASNGQNLGSGNDTKGLAYSKRIRSVGNFSGIKFKKGAPIVALELYATANAATPNNTLYLDLQEPMQQMARDYYKDARFNGNIRNMFGILYDSACFSIKTAPLQFDSLTQKVVVVYNQHGAQFRIQNHPDFDGAFDSYLFDRYTNTMHNLSNSPYIFLNDTTVKAHRFDWFLVGNGLALADHFSSVQPWIWWAVVNNQVTLFTAPAHSETSGKVTMYDLSGRKLFEGSGILHEMQLPAQSTGSTCLLVIDQKTAFKVQFP